MIPVLVSHHAEANDPIEWLNDPRKGILIQDGP